MSLTRRTWLLNRVLPAGAAAVASLSALAAEAAGGDGPARAATAGAAAVNPDLPVHPLLQIGAVREPDKKVSILVQKRSRNASSHEIGRAAGASVKEEFSFIKTLVLEVPQRVIPRLALNPQVLHISPNGPVRKHAISTSNLQTFYPEGVNAPAVWNSTALAQQATGKGVTVAVVDTGVASTHKDLMGANLVTVNVNLQSNGATDHHGHGTHCVGIVKGQHSRGRYIGVAPGARVVSVKVADDTGMASCADLLRGLQWVYDNRALLAIRAVNLSITSGTPESYKTSPVCAAAEQLWFAGVTVVVAAGNKGAANDSTWYAPANDPYVISVGALDDNWTADRADDRLCPFSSRGTTQDGFAKPEIVAPGRRIVSTLASNSCTLAQRLPARIQDRNYIRLSGTSMAAPVVTGAIALLLERYPTLTPNQVKGLLLSSARQFSNAAGAAGELDVFAAMSKAALGVLSPANQGLTPNSGIDLGSGTVQWSQAYWDQAYWDQAYWDQAYWDVAADYD